jgi:hypothetical protein
MKMTLKEYIETALMIMVIGVLHIIQKIKELFQKP